ncbi:MAG: hypothetical protein NTY06_03025 [Candidatus Gottesmanbacteria bacterium]|nr:hypothetical protein [Candidatus Gottesmanbacteria bacterium]
MYPVSKHDAIIATLAYADVFDYPLTHQEVLLWFLYYPVHFTDIPKGIGSRVKNKKAPWQTGKWAIASRASRWLSIVPTIQLVGVTGGLAMNNASRDDDIDLFFIVADGTLWVSRMMATLLMDILGLRRHPKDQQVANKVCLNMFMTESAMSLARHDRDCFTAHEVLQMAPLWEQKGTYRIFLRTNRWVARYLPNAWKEKEVTVVPKMCTSFPLVIVLMRLLEWSTKQLQLWYMARHRTSEVITDTTLRFHPKDARVWIKRKLRARLAKTHIPLDKVFYAS